MGEGQLERKKNIDLSEINVIEMPVRRALGIMPSGHKKDKYNPLSYIIHVLPNVNLVGDLKMPWMSWIL